MRKFQIYIYVNPCINVTVHMNLYMSYEKCKYWGKTSKWLRVNELLPKWECMLITCFWKADIGLFLRLCECGSTKKKIFVVNSIKSKFQDAMFQRKINIFFLKTFLWNVADKIENFQFKQTIEKKIVNIFFSWFVPVKQRIK